MSEDRRSSLPLPHPPYTELTLHTTLEASDGIISFLFDLGAAGVLIEGEAPLLTLRCHFRSDEGLKAKLQALEAYLRSLEEFGLVTGPGTIRAVPWEDTGWTTKWREYFKPFRVGRRWLIKPSWEEWTGGEGDLVLEIDPGMAFGTGLHATTRMCLEFLEEVLDAQSSVHGQRQEEDAKASSVGRRVGIGELKVLDLGTGSGILAIAAAKLGVGQVLALDLDPEACRVARENVWKNRVEDRVQVREGSLASAMGPFDLVIANLTTPALLPLLPALRWTVPPGGRLILAGILDEEWPRMRQALTAEGFRIIAERRSEGWVTFLVCPYEPLDEG